MIRICSCRARRVSGPRWGRQINLEMPGQQKLGGLNFGLFLCVKLPSSPRTRAQRMHGATEEGRQIKFGNAEITKTSKMNFGLFSCVKLPSSPRTRRARRVSGAQRMHGATEEGRQIKCENAGTTKTRQIEFWIAFVYKVAVLTENAPCPESFGCPAYSCGYIRL